MTERWHGTTDGYTNHHCRCTRCRAANAAYGQQIKAHRRKRLAADPTLAPHGRYTTYGNWMCRCGPCREAWAAYNRKRVAS